MFLFCCAQWICLLVTAVYVLLTLFLLKLRPSIASSLHCSPSNPLKMIPAAYKSEHSPWLIFWAIRKGNAKRTNVHFIIQNLKADDHLMSSEEGDRRRGQVNERESRRKSEDTSFKGWRVSYQGNHDSSCLLLIRSQRAEKENKKETNQKQIILLTKIPHISSNFKPQKIAPLFLVPLKGRAIYRMRLSCASRQLHNIAIMNAISRSLSVNYGSVY